MSRCGDRVFICYDGSGKEMCASVIRSNHENGRLVLGILHRSVTSTAESIQAKDTVL